MVKFQVQPQYLLQLLQVYQPRNHFHPPQPPRPPLKDPAAMGKMRTSYLLETITYLHAEGLSLEVNAAALLAIHGIYCSFYHSSYWHLFIPAC